MYKQPTNPSTWPSLVKRRMLLQVMVTEKAVEETRNEVKTWQRRWFSLLRAWMKPWTTLL